MHTYASTRKCVIYEEEVTSQIEHKVVLVIRGMLDFLARAF